MINENDLNIVREITSLLLQKMALGDFEIDIKPEEYLKKGGQDEGQNQVEGAVSINLQLKEPQFLIGKDGQTLFDLQRILRMLLNKRIQSKIYLKLDINNYQKQKAEYLKSFANSLADEVVLIKKEKSLPPMSTSDRRIIHEELSNRKDIIVQSKGEGKERRIFIEPVPGYKPDIHKLSR